jgi:hypothetical protein
VTEAWNCFWLTKRNFSQAKEQLEETLVVLADEMIASVLYLLRSQLEELYGQVHQICKSAHSTLNGQTSGLEVGSGAVQDPAKTPQESQEVQKRRLFYQAMNFDYQKWENVVSLAARALERSNPLAAWLELGKAIGEYLLRLWKLEVPDAIPDFRPAVVAAQKLRATDRGRVLQLEKMANISPGATKLNQIKVIKDVYSPASGSQSADEVAIIYDFGRFLTKNPTRNESGSLDGSGETSREGGPSDALVCEAKYSLITLDHSIQDYLKELTSDSALGPRWDQNSQKLWYGSTLCRSYERPAPNQEVFG